MTNNGWNGSLMWLPLMNWVYAYSEAMDPETDVITERLNELDRRVLALERRAHEMRNSVDRSGT